MIIAFILFIVQISHDIKIASDPLYDIKKQEIVSSDIKIKISDYNILSIYKYDQSSNIFIKIKDLKINLN